MQGRRLSLVSLGAFFLFSPQVFGDAQSNLNTYQENLRVHVGEDITKKVTKSSKNSNVWTSVNFAHTRNTSSEDPGSTSAYSGTVGGDHKVEKWTIGVSGGGVVSTIKDTFPPPSKTHNKSVLLQPYVSYALQNNVSLFGSFGILNTAGNTTEQTVPSNAHNLTLTYFGSGGVLFVLPSLEQKVFPTLRLSSTYFTSKIKSYYWGSTYYPSVYSHLATVDSAFRLNFTFMKGFIPYIEYGSHWIANRSQSISQEPRRRGQSFLVGSTISLDENYRLSLNYVRDNLPTPGYRDTFLARISLSF